MILELVSPYSEKPKVRHVSEFNLGSFTLMNNNFFTPFLPILGLLSGVKPHLNLLALVIPYSGNPTVTYYIVFKKQFCYPWFLLTSKGDFGVKAPSQTCLQSIFGILMAPQINTWGQIFWPS